MTLNELLAKIGIKTLNELLKLLAPALTQRAIELFTAGEVRAAGNTRKLAAVIAKLVD